MSLSLKERRFVTGMSQMADLLLFVFARVNVTCEGEHDFIVYAFCLRKSSLSEDCSSGNFLQAFTMFGQTQ